MNRKSKLGEEIKLREVVKNSQSLAEVLRNYSMKPRGGNYSTLNFYITKYNINIEHFKGQGWNTGELYKNFAKKDITYYLVEGRKCNSNNLKVRLFKEGIKEKVCEICKNDKWRGEDIALELHHKNGIKTDNRLDNLEVLCPNCHAMTDNYRGLNIKSGVVDGKKVPKKKSRNIKKDYKVCHTCKKRYYSKAKSFCSIHCYNKSRERKELTRVQLIKDFKALKSFTKVACKYGVTDNAVRKWNIKVGLPEKAKELNTFLHQTSL